MPALLQMLHQLAVVQKAARDLVETPIDDQCNMHGARLSFNAAEAAIAAGRTDESPIYLRIAGWRIALCMARRRVREVEQWRDAAADVVRAGLLACRGDFCGVLPVASART
jgi:hypothetical protein